MWTPATGTLSKHRGAKPELTPLMGDGILITGTDTGIGKTVIAAAIVTALRARDVDVRAHKPAMSGIDEPTPPDWPHDHVLLASTTGQDPDEVAPIQFGPAYSPHLAAALERVEIDPSALLQSARQAIDAADFTVVEGIGGLLVPITNDYRVRDFAQELALPLVVVARPGLGTINHTLLTVEAAQKANLEVRAIVLNPWPESPSELETSNLETIAAQTGIRTFTFGEITAPTQQELLATVPTDLVTLCCSDA